MKLGQSFQGKQMLLCHCFVFDACVFQLLLFCPCLFVRHLPCRQTCAERRKFLMALVFCLMITMGISAILDCLFNLQHLPIYSMFDTISNRLLKSR